MNAERIAVLAEAQTWAGTPFRDDAAIKGYRGGVDCSNFVAEVFKRALGMSEIELPRYNGQFMLNCRDELYISKLLMYFAEIRTEETAPGDIFCLKWGHIYSHAGILLTSWQGRVIHALHPFGVISNDASRDARLLASLRKYRAFPPRFFRPRNW